jgi:hypothetical protein
VNHDVARSLVFREPAAGLEGEQQEPKRPPMDQSGLPMTSGGRVRFCPESTDESREIEGDHRTRQPGARMRPEPIAGLFH